MINPKQFEDRIKEADTIITNLIQEKKIITSLSEQEKIKFSKFYQKHAATSLKRAKEFLAEIEKIIM